MKLSLILCSPRWVAIALVAGTVVLGGCGQKGDLFIPANTNRASLPDTLRPAAATSPAGTASSAAPAR